MQAATEVLRKIWTRDEARILVDLGFPNAEKLELIEGELINRMGKKHPHVFWQHVTLAWLQDVFGREFVRSESPADVSPADNPTSEPEPDLLVTSKSLWDYTNNPPPGDILLAVEIADSTRYLDLNIKAKLYARAEIVEYWVLLIPEQKLVVHRAPQEGVYSDVKVYLAQDEISPLAAPEARFCLERIAARP